MPGQVPRGQEGNEASAAIPAVLVLHGHCLICQLSPPRCSHPPQQQCGAWGVSYVGVIKQSLPLALPVSGGGICIRSLIPRLLPAVCFCRLGAVHLQRCHVLSYHTQASMHSMLPLALLGCWRHAGAQAMGAEAAVLLWYCLSAADRTENSEVRSCNVALQLQISLTSSLIRKIVSSVFLDPGSRCVVQAALELTM